MVKTQDSATIKRTLYFFWQITKKRPWPFALGVIATIGFIGMLTYANTYVMSLIVDRIQLGPVGPDQVWEVFGPYIIALILVNVVGQVWLEAPGTTPSSRPRSTATTTSRASASIRSLTSP